jgi:hypothetical protein
LPDVVKNVAKLFADDTKLYAAVNNTNDEIKLQGDIDRLMQWSKEWLLTFNKSKCKHVHFGPPIMLDIKWEGISSSNLQKRKTLVSL